MPATKTKPINWDKALASFFNDLAKASKGSKPLVSFFKDCAAIAKGK